MQDQEELARLFANNMTLEQVQQQVVPFQQPQQPQQEQKIVYASTHYTHSAHVAPKRDVEAENVLKNHGVSTEGLSTAQLTLFRTVDDPEKLRLIELWRTCPPKNDVNDNPTLGWSMTSVNQEEAMARARLDQQMQQQIQEAAEAAEAQEQEVVMSLDGTPLTPIQGGDGRWIDDRSQHYMEPYMASGYEEMARREYEESARKAYAESMERPKDIYSHFGIAVGGPTYNPQHSDPVYAASSGGGIDWRQEAMADQYGRMMAMRN